MKRPEPLGYVRRHHVGLLALMFALGGTSYAAVLLPAHSVGTVQLRDGAVTRAKLSVNAVSSAQVKDHSILARDFKPGQLPAGAPGRGAQRVIGERQARREPAVPGDQSGRADRRATRSTPNSQAARRSGAPTRSPGPPRPKGVSSPRSPRPMRRSLRPHPGFT
jgi:hypothetical protein